MKGRIVLRTAWSAIKNIVKTTFTVGSAIVAVAISANTVASATFTATSATFAVASAINVFAISANAVASATFTAASAIKNVASERKIVGSERKNTAIFLQRIGIANENLGINRVKRKGATFVLP